VPPLVDVDNLIDAVAAAEILGLSSRNGVAVYRKRYDTFPKPVVDLGPGRPLLWLRDDVEAWAASRKR
jgi:predicted DNA-binding transcriptional regulator AlpA